MKSVYGPGISEEEALSKLRELVKETEKELVEKNLVDKKHLTADRTFVLFDPEPYLDDVDQFQNYSPLELVDIITNYNSDINKYEAAKKSMADKCVLSNRCEKEYSDNVQVFQNNDSSKNFNHVDNKVSNTNADQQPLGENTPPNNSEKNQSSNEVFSERNSLNESNNSNNSKINENSEQRPQFTNIYDLFQIPDLSILKPANLDNSDSHLTKEKEYSDSRACETGNVQEENSDEVEWTGEEDHPSESEQEDYPSESEQEDEESFSYDVEDESNESVSIDEDIGEKSTYEDDSVDEDEEEIINESNEDVEDESINENKEVAGITNENINDEGDNYAQDYDHEKYSSKCKGSVKKYFNCPNREKKVMLLRSSRKIMDNDKQLVNYDFMNEWYGQWRKQLNVIQKCVGISKQ